MRQFLLVAALLSASVGRGQALPAGTGPGSLVTVGGTVSGFHLQYGNRDLGGYGAYVDMNSSWRYGAEGEVRFLRLNEEFGTHATTILGGPRISFRPHRLKPYAKVLVGLGRFDFPFGYAYGNYFVVAPGAGVDLRLPSVRGLNRRVTLRLIDVQYQDWTGFTFGGLHPYGISSGISFSLFRSGTKQED